MTPEERACNIADPYVVDPRVDPVQLAVRIEDAIRAAVAEEREACIQDIKNTMSAHPGSHAAAIRAIRERGKES
jgi:hypothetical protein